MIARRTPIARKRATPRKWKCVVCRDYVSGKVCPTCRTRKGTMRKALTARADTLWAKAVKAGGACMARQILFPCAGALEACHVVPRRHRSTRWLLSNGRAMCHAHHHYFTNHERAWRDYIGPDWDLLWDIAQERWTGAYPIAELRATRPPLTPPEVP